MKMVGRLGLAVATGLLLITLPLGARSQFSGNLKLIGSTIPEAKVESGINYQIPLLQGSSLLTSGNNLKLKALLGISPIAATLNLDAVLTPVAIAEINLGGIIGTGWDLNADLQGLRRIQAGSTTIESLPFKGARVGGKIGAALQFDTGALFSGDWSSVVSRTYHELRLEQLTAASHEDLWSYELGDFVANGYFYHGEFLVGYQMPMKVNMIALMLEIDQNNIFSTAKSDRVLTLSAVANLQILRNLDLTMVAQFTNKKLLASALSSSEEAKTKEGALRFSRVVGMLNYCF